MKTALTVFVFALTAGLAHAQSPSIHTIAHAAGGPPGTVGAMQSATYGIATSPLDVALQQRGLTTVADGAQPIAAEIISGSAAASAGTVGASPGSKPGE